MGAFFNKVLLLGNLTADPELRYTASGVAICNFRLAVNRKYKDIGSGELKDEVLFIKIDVWGNQAENCANYLTKGKSIFVEGRLKLKEWEGREGEKKKDYVVVASNIQFLKNGKDFENKTKTESNDTKYDKEILPF